MKNPMNLKTFSSAIITIAYLNIHFTLMFADKLWAPRILLVKWKTIHLHSMHWMLFNLKYSYYKVRSKPSRIKMIFSHSFKLSWSTKIQENFLNNFILKFTAQGHLKNGRKKIHFISVSNNNASKWLNLNDCGFNFDTSYG